MPKVFLPGENIWDAANYLRLLALLKHVRLATNVSDTVVTDGIRAYTTGLALSTRGRGI